jgi:PhzF family phenazine biosynthesis protein
MKLKLFHVDAFASRPFEGNPAAVCPLEEWLEDSVLQSIAGENNLSETAFFVQQDGGYSLRWFTPVTEVDLCGHATLASAHVLFQHLGYSEKTIRFHTRSGQLLVEKKDGFLHMNFPAITSYQCKAPGPLSEALGTDCPLVFCADDYMAVFPDEKTIKNLSPDFYLLSRLDLRGVIVTAPGDTTDFASRCFFPKLGIPEDPVTGSAHCQLTPYWATRIGKTKMEARQISQRGGSLVCELLRDRVRISGKAVTFMEGVIALEGVSAVKDSGIDPDLI